MLDSDSNITKDLKWSMAMSPKNYECVHYTKQPILYLPHFRGNTGWSGIDTPAAYGKIMTYGDPKRKLDIDL